MTRFSVFTASHDPRFLDDCWRSLQAQTHGDWEWVLLLNGGASWQVHDPRVRIHQQDVHGVGAAKAAAVAYCQGEVLVELDHDDLLASGALDALDKAFTDGTGFVYSDGAYIREDGTPDPFVLDPAHGLAQRTERVDGLEVLAIDSLAPTPHNVSYIWYAPNHVRAFTRQAYDQAGGYDPQRVVCDDQDLMCRLFQVTAFRHVPECLYLQRRYDGSTQRLEQFNARIQSQTVELYDRYVDANARAWAQREGLHVLDLKGDPTQALSNIGTNSFGLLTAHDVLQRVRNPVEFFNQAHRVLRHGGLLLTSTPSTDGRGAFQDPTHVSFFNENSFWYYTDATKAGYVPGLTARFQTSRVETHFRDEWYEANQISYVRANLVALKDGPRQGGLLRW